MYLKQFIFDSGAWKLALDGLQMQNLFVGKNSIGKSKAINAISDVASIIAQTQRDIPSHLSVELVLCDKSEEYFYSFLFDDKNVRRESLIVSSLTDPKRVIVNRTATSSFLDGNNVNAPVDRLIIHVQRDTVAFPEFEALISWAENVNGFSFNELDSSLDTKSYAWFVGHSIPLYDIINTITKEDESAVQPIIERLRQVGYPINQISKLSFEEVKNLKIVIVSEDKVSTPLFIGFMSKGMRRTLYVLSLLEYMSKLGCPSMLLIDDLCEGLDYDRSVKVGKMVFEFCRDNNIQLIASSNDSYLMDAVDLDNWHILVRDGSNVKAINKSSDPSIFEDFELTGLNNFNLLSSDFIQRYNKQ